MIGSAGCSVDVYDASSNDKAFQLSAVLPIELSQLVEDCKHLTCKHCCSCDFQCNLNDLAGFQ